MQSDASGREILSSSCVEKTIKNIQRVAYGPSVNALHRMFFTHAIKFHCDDLDAQWRELEETTGLWANDVLNKVFSKRRGLIRTGLRSVRRVVKYKILRKPKRHV